MTEQVTLFSVNSTEILTNNDERYKSHLNDKMVSDIRNLLVQNGYDHKFDIVRKRTGKTQPFLVVHSTELNVVEFLKVCMTSGINVILDSGIEQN